MRDISQSPSVAATEIVGVTDSSQEGSFQPGLFGDFARLAFPQKTDVMLAIIGRATDRSARAWMSGTASPPPFVAAACFTEIMRRCRCK